MANKDQTESDWTGWLTDRFGTGITRRNVAIGVPIVENFRIPTKRYNDGTVDPPSAAKNWNHTHFAAEPLIHEEIPHITSKQAYVSLDTNPNYKGDGYYYPEYTKHDIYYELPEWPVNQRTEPHKKKDFPLEIRRRLYY